MNAWYYYTISITVSFSLFFLLFSLNKLISYLFLSAVRRRSIDFICLYTIRKQWNYLVNFYLNKLKKIQFFRPDAHSQLYTEHVWVADMEQKAACRFLFFSFVYMFCSISKKISKLHFNNLVKTEGIFPKLINL